MNDLRLTKAIGGHEITGGVYFSDYRFEQVRYFNSMLLEMRDEPRALDVLALDAAGNLVGSVTENGFLSYVDNGDIGGRVDGELRALYAMDDWKVTDNLRLDAGLDASGLTRAARPFSARRRISVTRARSQTTASADLACTTRDPKRSGQRLGPSV